MIRRLFGSCRNSVYVTTSLPELYICMSVVAIFERIATMRYFADKYRFSF